MKTNWIVRLFALLLAFSCLLLPISCGEEKEPVSEPASQPEVSSVAAPLYDYGRPVPRVEGDWARKAYFSDAVFVGDSVTTGLTLYSYFENATILAERGIDPQNIFEKKVVSTGKTVMEGLKEKQFGKVYIMLGANAAVYMDEKTFADAYTRMLAEIKALQPDALIYVQAVFPITEKLSAQNKADGKGLTNERIRAYNMELLKIAQKEKVYFVNTYEAMAEKGVLPAAYSPDGVHINAAQYQLWYDYLRSHVVKKEQINK